MPRFTAGELQVMRILWEFGELKPAEIQEHFPDEIKNPALRSYLSILLDKGHVTRRRKGKAYYYKARTRRTSTFRTMLQEVIDVCCAGSTEAFMLNLIRSEELSAADLLRLKRLAEADPAPSANPEKHQ